MIWLVDWIGGPLLLCFANSILSIQQIIIVKPAFLAMLSLVIFVALLADNDVSAFKRKLYHALSCVESVWKQFPIHHPAQWVLNVGQNIHDC